jgi:hypothetical protein
MLAFKMVPIIGTLYRLIALTNAYFFNSTVSLYPRLYPRFNFDAQLFKSWSTRDHTLRSG